MAGTMGSAGKSVRVGGSLIFSEAQCFQSIPRLWTLLKKSEYRSYDTLDCLSSIYFCPFALATGSISNCRAKRPKS